jgi:fatty-acid desaturase
MNKKLNSYFWLIFLPAHILLLVSLYYIEFSLKSFLLILLFWTLISGYGIGVAYHRLLSHNAFKTWPIIETIISYLGCLAIQGSPLFWVNIHRGYHHPHSDTPEDIHSPIHGKLWAYFLWTIQVNYKDLKFNSVFRMMKKKDQLFLHHFYFQIIWATWILTFIISTQLFYSLIVAQILTLHLEFMVNLFCHTKSGGYRNFDLKDNSVNYYLFGLLCWGIGYHNNHHARPQSYDFGYKKFEFDPTTVLVRLIKKADHANL